ncbi:hypothetical protein HYH03_011015 [Edaphochlamys debaryana]|uniref:Uncharacterized protein n=1 Tax=Edaphochlamys debaryana TaxID=47281 RepID=A0A835Y403_9CHLO|nr:hypothetical protein HYH03_011015 [Edaphochlamys debaryana]|eukprot:KAG2490624.1 hypothetical protein HYH03_011015 [Edaphochlamys debaryana]
MSPPPLSPGHGSRGSAGNSPGPHYGLGGLSSPHGHSLGSIPGVHSHGLGSLPGNHHPPLSPVHTGAYGGVDPYQGRRLSMPGNMQLQGFGPTFCFPNLAPSSMTMSGGAIHQRHSRLGSTHSGPVTGLDSHLGSYASPHHLSRGTTPMASTIPTPRSSVTGSVWGGSEAAYSIDLDDRHRAIRRALSGVERGLDTPVWVARGRLLGRLLLSALFANLLWQELREWRSIKGHGWREWYDVSWAAEEMPPLPTVLSGVCLALLLCGAATSAAAGFLALRLVLQCAQTWEEMVAVLMEQTSNLLPVKELAVVGTVIVFIGHTYYLPDWLRRGRKRSKGKAKGLLYTQQWRPGQVLLLGLGKLLLVPLFVSVCAMQYFDVVNPAVGLEGWKERLLHPYYWAPPGDSSTNNWLPLQAAAYVITMLGISNKAVPSVLAALLVAEAFTCWRFWSPAWISAHYVAYLRRHFCANLAIAGGLLLNLPEGKHDAEAAKRESAIGKKRA